MSVGVQAPYPQLGSAGATKFVPEIWSGKILVKFYQSTCLTEVTNSDWEGEVKQVGDKVWIRVVPDVTIRDYLKGQTLTTETPTSAPVQLVVDKAKYFAVVVDDIDKAQADVKLMDMYTSDASQKMKITIERQVFGAVYADVPVANKGTAAGKESGSINLGTEASPVSVTASNAVDKLLDAGNVLDEQDVPREGRFAIIPPWYARHLKASDLKDASLTGDATSPLRNGRIGRIDDMTVFVSNNLAKITASGNKWHVLIGTRDAISWAAQLTEVETLRAQTTFGWILRGLNVYGFKVTKGEALVDLVVSRG
jgi:hypothetical protein